MRLLPSLLTPELPLLAGGFQRLIALGPDQRSHSGRLGEKILTKAMERRPEVGLDSYDRFFPNQDTLPQGGFGNLIALPLQRRSREFGSVSLDERLAPFPDECNGSFCRSIRKISRCEVETIVRSAESKGRAMGIRSAPDGGEHAAPWLSLPSRRWVGTSISGPLPEALDLTQGNQIYIPKEDCLPPSATESTPNFRGFLQLCRTNSEPLPLYTTESVRVLMGQGICAIK
ncbi:MAG: TOTE conflict system archaeo-eukaryotic primase domain-containing protein [Acidobacteriaceae bacterium]